MAKTKEEKAAYNREWRKNNRDKVRSYQKRYSKTEKGKAAQARSQKKWKANNPEKARDIRIRASWGFGAEHYDSLIAEFGGKCGHCGTTKNLRLDHCHKTGRIRGVLCNTHNLGLGKIGDTIEDVRSLLRYMEEQEQREHDHFVTGGKYGREILT